MLSDLVVFRKCYDFLLWVKPTVERFSRVHRYGLGVQLETECLSLLKGVARANVKREKKEAIEECLACFECVKVLVRLSMDFRLLSVKQYGFACVELDTIGKLLFGWFKKFEAVSC